MRVRKVRLDVMLVLVVIAAVAAVLLFREATAGGTSDPTASSPRAAAERFAAAYAQFLDGRRSEAELPLSTARVQGIARGGGTIPQSGRSGAARVANIALKWVSGAPTAQAVGTVSDGRHRFTFDVGMAYADSSWAVVYLVPPDMPTVLARTPSRPAPGAKLEQAARRFALAYVGYRSGVESSAPGGDAAIRAQIAADKDPLAEIASSSSAPSVSSLSFGPAQGDLVAATARVRAGSEQQRFTFLLARRGAAWQPWSFLESGS